jgi:hypothetical protein
MVVPIVLEPLPTHTQYVPLAVLGYCLTRTGFLTPVWDAIEWPMKVVVHRPQDKLQDVLVSILAGLATVAAVNTRLRPDLTLSAAWQRPRFAEQSTLADTLNALGPDQIRQLRLGSEALFRRYSRTMRHDFTRHWLMLDVDPTGLLASRNAEGSCKGYIAGAINRYGRQLQRLSVPTYHENLHSALYPGNQQAMCMLQPAILAAEALLGLTPEQRQRTIIRTDAAAGTDRNVNWLLWRHYQVLCKGFSGGRAVSWARQVDPAAWLEDAPRQRWIACAPHPPRFGRRINVFVLRWHAKEQMRHGTLLSTLLPLTPLATLRLHDGRGAMEVEIKADKQGLHLPKRRKKSFLAQEGLALLTDLAHNLLSWTHHWILEEGPFDSFGTQRMVAELMCIPGRLEIMDGKLDKVALLASHPYAAEMRLALGQLLGFFDNP